MSEHELVMWVFVLVMAVWITALRSLWSWASGLNQPPANEKEGIGRNEEFEVK